MGEGLKGNNILDAPREGAVGRGVLNRILLGDGPVKRINTAFFYQLGGYLRRLQEVSKETMWRDASPFLYLTKFSLGDLIKQEPVALTYCISHAKELEGYVTELIEIKEARTFTDVEVIKLKWLAENFESSLITELAETNTYFVSPVGIFSTSALLTKAEEMFGEHRDLLPSVTVTQIQEAGKCLAFSLGSAAAFHLFSALESVLREYYDKLSGGKGRPKNPSMGAYIGELSELPGVDAKLLAALRQVKDLHRNPAIHFENVLTMGEALTLVGMIHSAISTTLAVVAKLSQKP